MKLLTSPSISSSSTVSFDAKMCTSKRATAGCLAGILRRILCSRSLPTHPSDHTTEASSIAFDKQQERNGADKVEAMATPGIVARLMGLDSLPEIGNLDAQVKPNSISRTRSMNAADYMQDTDRMQGKHRRVNSTLSFRDMPTFLELENDEFFVLSFEKEGESRELRSKGRRCKVGNGEIKQKKSDKLKEEENKGERVSEGKRKEEQQAGKKALNVLIEEELVRRTADKRNQDVAKCGSTEDLTDTFLSFKDSSDKQALTINALGSSKFAERMGVPTEAKSRKKKKKKTRNSLARDVDPDCSSEDSSPVSVLDFDKFIFDHEVRASDEDSKLRDSRRKLSPELEDHGCPSPRNDGTLMDSDPRIETVEGPSWGARKQDCHSEKYLVLLDAICRMAESEAAESSWSYSRIFKHEDVEDVAADFSLQIVDQLLDELVVQLFELPIKV